MTYWAPLRAGTPKLSAAGPDRNVTIPSLKVSCAKDGAAKVSVVAVTTDKSATARSIREKWFMILSPGFPAVGPPVFGRAGCPAAAVIIASLGGLSRRVYGCRGARICSGAASGRRDGNQPSRWQLAIENGDRAGPASRGALDLDRKA